MKTIRKIAFFTLLLMCTIVSNAQRTHPPGGGGFSQVVQTYSLTKCENESITLDPGAGYDSYTWSDGSTNQTLTVSSSGVYAVSLLTGSVTSTKLYNISDYPVNDPGPDFLGPDILRCAYPNALNTLYQIDAPSGYVSYMWSDGVTLEDRTISVNNNTNLTLVLTMEDQYGCYTYTDDIHIESVTPPTVTLSGVTPNYISGNGGQYYIHCENDPNNYASPFTLSVPSGFVSYEWYNSTNTTNTEVITQDGEYAVIVTDANGCTATDQITFRSAPVENMQIFQKGVFCGDNTVALSANYQWNSNIEQIFTYSWTLDGTVVTSGTFPNNSGSANVLENVSTPGVYEFTLTNQYGCTASAQYVVGIALPLSLNAVATDLTCIGYNDGEIQLSPMGGTGLPYTFDWDVDGIGDWDDQEDLTALTPGTYTVVVQDANKCEASETIVIGVEDREIPDVLAVSGLSCDPTTAVSIDGINEIEAELEDCDGKYEFVITDVTSGTPLCNKEDLTIIWDDNTLPFSAICGVIKYDHTYEVKVRSFKPDPITGSIPGANTPGYNDYPAAWLSQYGSVCTFTTEQHPFSYIDNCSSIDLSNGAIVSSQNIVATPVNCAIIYQFRLIELDDNDNPTGVELTSISFTNSTSLSEFSGCELIKFDTKYQIEVRTKAGGCWGPWTSEDPNQPLLCTILTGSHPSSEIVSPACYTVVNMSGTITASGVTCADVYDFQGVEITDASDLNNLQYGGSSIYTNGGINPTVMTFNNLFGVQYNTSYEISVQTHVGTQLSGFGNGCVLSTPLEHEYCITHPICDGTMATSDGEITVTIIGGLLPIEYCWYEKVGATEIPIGNCYTTTDATTTISNLDPGTYVLHAHDANPLRCVDPNCTPQFHIGELHLTVTIGVDPQEYPPGVFDGGNGLEVCYPINYSGLSDQGNELWTAEQKAHQQLLTYPLPRYQQDHTLRSNFSGWIPAQFLGGAAQGMGSTGVTQAGIIQRELAHNWNYTVQVGANLSVETFDTDPAVGSYTETSLNIVLSEPYIPSSASSYWLQIPGGNIKNGSLDPIHYVTNYYNIPNTRVAGFAPKDPYLAGTIDNSLILTSLEGDGNTIRHNLSNLLGLLNSGNANLDYMDEDGEADPHVFGGSILVQDETIDDEIRSTIYYSPSGAYNWYGYESDRKYKIRKAYSDRFTSLLDSTVTAFDWYQIEGYGCSPGTKFFQDYLPNREIAFQLNNNPNGVADYDHYSKADLYLRRPGIWKSVGSGADHGWLWLDRGRKREIALGDKLNAPYVAAGWSHDITKNIRPGQWLGFLKAVGMLGAEYYYPGYFNVNDSETPYLDWRIPAFWAWQASTPSYAQAITSRYEKYMRDGNVIQPTTQLSGNYSFTSFSTDMLVVARKIDGEEDYAITGTIQPSRNIGCSVPVDNTATINLPNGDELTFEVTRQGSTYIYDKTYKDVNGTDYPTPVFYQLDSWHEYMHPSRWQQHLFFEAEVHDLAENNGTATDLTIRTEKESDGSLITDGNYLDYVSYVSSNNASVNNTTISIVDPVLNYTLASGSNEPPYVDYIFQARNGDDYDLYVRARRTAAYSGTESGGIFIEVIEKTSGNIKISDYIGCINNTNFEWYTQGMCNQSGGGSIAVTGLDEDKDYILRLYLENDLVQIDKAALLIAGTTNLSDLGIQPGDINTATCAPPTIIPSFDYNAPCVGNATEFFNTTNFKLSCSEYTWDFGDGCIVSNFNTGDGANDLVDPANVSGSGCVVGGTYADPTHQFMNTGIYGVSLTVNNPQQAGPYSFNITVMDPPVVTVTSDAITWSHTGNGAICRTENTTLTAGVMPANPGFGYPYTYTWGDDNGFPMGLSPVAGVNDGSEQEFTLYTSHNYVVTLTDVEGCYGTAPITIDVVDLTANIEFLDCANNAPGKLNLEAIPYNDGSTSNLLLSNMVYSWSAVDPLDITNTSVISSATFNPGTADSKIEEVGTAEDTEFRVTITEGEIGCKAMDTVVVAKPEVDFLIIAPCIGNTTEFTTYNENTEKYTTTNLIACSKFYWDVDRYNTGTGMWEDIFTSTDQISTAYDFTVAGDYSVTLTVVNIEDQFGNPVLFDSQIHTFTVYDKPDAILELVDINTGVVTTLVDPISINACIEQPIQIYGQSSVSNVPGSGLAYNWMSASGTLYGINSTHIGINPYAVHSANETFFAQDLNPDPANGDIVGYQFKVTDNLGCYDIRDVSFVVGVVSVDPVISACFVPGDVTSGFQLEANASGGDGNYSYQWISVTDNGGNIILSDGTIANPIATPLVPPSAFNVIVTDGLGCKATGNVVLDNLAANFTYTPACAGAAVTFDANTSLNTVDCSTYDWDFDGTSATGITATHTFNTAGIYPVSLTVTNYDAGGGLGIFHVTVVDVTVTERPTIASVNSTDLVCNGVPAGQIVVNAGVTGTPPYNYSVGGAFVSNNIFDNLSAGNYTVSIQDDNLCESDPVSVVLTEPTALALSAVVNNVSVFGANDGSIDLAVSGGMPGYSYLWSANTAPNQSNEDQTSLSGGVYDVTVTDNNNCTITDSYTVIEPPCAVVSDINSGNTTEYIYFDSTPVNGNGNNGGNNNQTSSLVNNIDLNAAVGGGLNPYSINWLPTGETTNLINVAYNDATINETTGTYTYTVNVVDAAGCSAVDDISVQVIDINGGIPSAACDNGGCQNVCMWQDANGNGTVEANEFETVSVNCNPGLGNDDICDLMAASPPYILVDCDTYAPVFKMDPGLSDPAELEVNTNSGNTFDVYMMAFPNPTSDKTTIAFQVSDDKNVVSLHVYNVLGEKLVELYTGQANAGQQYQFEFNGNNYNSGTYYYTLRTNDNVYTKKFVILK